MAKFAKCPKCSVQIDLSSADASGRVLCASCGSKFRLPGSKSSSADQQGLPAPSKPTGDHAAASGKTAAAKDVVTPNAANDPKLPSSKKQTQVATTPSAEATSSKVSATGTRRSPKDHEGKKSSSGDTEPARRSRDERPKAPPHVAEKVEDEYGMDIDDEFAVEVGDEFSWDDDESTSDDWGYEPYEASSSVPPRKSGKTAGAAPKTQSRKSSDKSSAKSPFSLRGRIALGAAGAGLVAVIAMIAAFSGSGSEAEKGTGTSGSDTVAAGEAGAVSQPEAAPVADFGGTRTSAPVTLDQPVTGIRTEFSQRPDPGPLFEAASAYDEASSKNVSVTGPIGKKLRAVEHDAGKRPEVISVDPSKAVSVRIEPPGTWQAVSLMPESADFLKGIEELPWPDAFGKKTAVKFVLQHKKDAESDAGKKTVVHGMLRRIDLEKGEFVGEPIAMFPWVSGEEDILGDDIGQVLSIGQSVDGERFVFADPATLGRIDVWSREGRRLVGFHPFETKAEIEWNSFTADGRLLALAAGEFSAWEVGEGFAKPVYRTQGGGYTNPVSWTSDRKHLVASRAGSFDILDPSTGKCINRIGSGVDGYVVDIAFSHDGKHVAALYADDLQFASTAVLRRGLDYSKSGGTVVVWDLGTGNARIRKLGLYQFGVLSFVAPELLLVASHDDSILLDLRLDEVTQRMKIEESHRGVCKCPVRRSPDGRLWLPVIRQEKDGIRETRWQLSTVSGAPIDRNDELFADDRRIIDIQKTPLRVELDLGSEELAQKRGVETITDLQKRGFNIGANGLTLRITPTVDVLKVDRKLGGQPFQIPYVVFDWRLIDTSGRSMWAVKTRALPVDEGSKYRIKNSSGNSKNNGLEKFDLLTRFDYGDKDPRAAIIEEILEIGDALEKDSMRPWRKGILAPDELPQRLIFGNGQYHVYFDSYYAVRYQEISSVQSRRASHERIKEFKQ